MRPFREAAESESGRPIVLAVGDLTEWLSKGREVPVGGKVAFVEFSDLTRELFEIYGPSFVLSPLLAHGFDCIDVSQVLQSLGFKGQYRAMAHNVPDPGLIKREISAICPDVDFDIIRIEEFERVLPN